MLFPPHGAALSPQRHDLCCAQRRRRLSRRSHLLFGGRRLCRGRKRHRRRTHQGGRHTPLPYPFDTAAELLTQCQTHGLSISQIMLANEQAWRSEAEVRAGLAAHLGVMQECVQRGITSEGILPGGMKVKRRAAELYRQLVDAPGGQPARPAQRDGLGQCLRHRRQRGERMGRARGDRAHQRRGGHHPGGAALLRPLHPRRQRRRRDPLSAHRRRDWHALQEERQHLWRRCGLPGRGGRRLFDGGGRAGRGARRHARSGRETPPRSAWSTTWG
jgi:hypothetical protein